MYKHAIRGSCAAVWVTDDRSCIQILHMCIVASAFGTLFIDKRRQRFHNAHIHVAINYLLHSMQLLRPLTAINKIHVASIQKDAHNFMIVSHLHCKCMSSVSDYLKSKIR